MVGCTGFRGHLRGLDPRLLTRRSWQRRGRQIYLNDTSILMMSMRITLCVVLVVAFLANVELAEAQCPPLLYIYARTVLAASCAMHSTGRRLLSLEQCCE